MTTTVPFADELASLEVQFDQACQLTPPTGVRCTKPAKWIIHTEHGFTHHKAGGGFACPDCKAGAEVQWFLFLMNGVNCSCGYVCAGLLGDHFRALKL